MIPNRIAAMLLLSISWSTAPSQDVALMNRLKRAATVDALDTLDTKPWHALMNVEIFDAKGKNPTNGTIEVWQSGTDRRVLYVFGAASLTEVVKDKSTYRTAAGPQFPRYAPFFLAKVLHVGPTIYQVEHTLPLLQPQKSGGEKLDCIAMQPPTWGGAVAQSPADLPTYCFDGEDHLRETFNFQQTVLLDKPAEFLGHSVSKVVSVANSGIPTATAKIVKLETFTPSADRFTPSADMPLFVPRARISGGVMAGQILNKVSPAYPASAHVGGTVVLHAIIGKTGHVQSLEAVSSPDISLSQAAMDAVKQWIYKPYLLNGEPVEVDTTITVNFNQ